MCETLADAIDTLSLPGRGLHFTSGDTATSFIDFRQLRERVQSLARKLSAVCGNRGEPTILIFADQQEFVLGFLAAIRAGLTAVPVYPPYLTGNLEEYASRVERIRHITGARLILTSNTLVNPLQPFLPDAWLVALSEIDAGCERGELPRICSSDTALIQFTSGSTAAPRGVVLAHRNLISNAVAIKQALALDPERDRGVSWLPLHHDMGLIGFLVTPILTQTSNWFLSPLEFARRPHRWLDLLDRTRGTISYAPNFGYDLTARRIREADVEKWDLSDWRVAGCGGEPVLAGVLDRFADLLRPAGFSRTSFVPSYGLAEATLAVTMAPLRRGIVTHSLSGDGQSDRPLVSSGRLITGTEIRIVSPFGNPLPVGMEGEIQVRGPGVATGFWNDNGFDRACCADGWLKTGDMGALIEGELHVSGRIKEVVSLNGCKYYPHDIEECVQDIDGVKRGNAVAFGRPGAGSEQLVLVVETKSSDDAAGLRRRLRARIRERLGLNVAEVVVVGRGVISRTTSGKLRRRAMRELYLSHELQGEGG
ncbi:MAG: AMP-binding protein [Candidatus Thiodiazotropha sp. (ex Dulcina madagascariensis)]|nr:AMP-binding protein [Candidatus Thiodiazotropha sp. (ex Epidulcina cf. delphinae)]MCU7923226.1 AMP-binding protein [Candidatus Thiodiazotropha sp. (ex Dulcina madagascariensis)]MCU7929056.1 AMP-binding protein [Candidatus Thiodiazotropha sp. (ex Dulcina madagascariensis)]